MSRPKQQSRPNPGSDAALDAGCTCPVLDNGHGTGRLQGADILFWVAADCPLHSVEDKRAELASSSINCY